MPPSRSELQSGIVGGIIAGIPLGLLLHLGVGTDTIEMQATVYVANPGVLTGWLVHMLHSLVFGLAYAGIGFLFTSKYINVVLSLTSRSDTLAAAFLPAIDRFGMTVVVSTAMAAKFGIVVWLLFPVSIFPMVTGVPGYAFPQVAVLPFLGYLLFGLVLGPVYGVQMRG